MRPMPLFVPDHSGYLEALMLLITLSGGLSMMHVSSLMVSYTHWLSTSLVSIVFPVYIMSIAYWRARLIIGVACLDGALESLGTL